MRQFGFALVYTALAMGANAAAAQEVDVATLSAMREGDMRKLIFHETPVETSAATFFTVDEQPLTLAEFEGGYVLLNFWATWCAPCRKEMPMLAEVQSELQSDRFQVVTVATGRNSVTGMRKFFEDIGVTNLPLHRDPKQTLARDMAVLGLPITVLLNPQGKEIARLRGDAIWNSDNAKAILNAAIGADSAS